MPNQMNNIEANSLLFQLEKIIGDLISSTSTVALNNGCDTLKKVVESVFSSLIPDPIVTMGVDIDKSRNSKFSIS